LGVGQRVITAVMIIILFALDTALLASGQDKESDLVSSAVSCRWIGPSRVVGKVLSAGFELIVTALS
jgi:hypothetical protein